LIQTWAAIFESPFEGLRHVLGGAETSQNLDILYLVWKERELAGTCHLTYTEFDPTLGGLGDVATGSEPEEIIEDNFRAITELAQLHGIKEGYSEDGVHPNNRGYQLMVPLAEAAIEKVLK
jgi:hypothetical protein